jgi:hypothetical protein
VFCDCCHSLIIPNAYPIPKRLNDGRNICGYCLFDFVRDEQMLNKAYRQVLSVYHKAGIHLPLDRMELKLCKKGELHTATCNNPIGITRTTKTSFSKNRYVVEILSTNYTYVVDTLAHELMHVVQDELNLKLDKQHSEGLCECAAYLVLQTIQSDVAKQLNLSKEQNPDTIYGDGFRLVKAKIIRAGSVQRFISHLRN